MTQTLQKGAFPLKDSNIVDAISDIFVNLNSSEILTSTSIREDFLSKYISWIKSSSLVEYKGLNNFKYTSYTHGTIQAFDLFYAEFSSRRFRCFKGDFLYHSLSWRNNYNFEYLENDNLGTNDAVVISMPFSDNGGIHPMTYDIIKECDKLNIPVLIDSAYMNISKGITVDLEYDCIHTVCFSLSKAFYSIDRLRVGMRLQRVFKDDPIDVFNSIGMVNNIGAYVGINLLYNFNPDYIPKKYSSKQSLICKEFNLTPSDCVIFGIGGDEYSDFNRGGELNRVCISDILKN